MRQWVPKTSQIFEGAKLKPKPRQPRWSPHSEDSLALASKHIKRRIPFKGVVSTVHCNGPITKGPELWTTPPSRRRNAAQSARAEVGMTGSSYNTYNFPFLLISRQLCTLWRLSIMCFSMQLIITQSWNSQILLRTTNFSKRKRINHQNKV